MFPSHRLAFLTIALLAPLIFPAPCLTQLLVEIEFLPLGQQPVILDFVAQSGEFPLHLPITVFMLGGECFTLFPALRQSRIALLLVLFPQDVRLGRLISHGGDFVTFFRCRPYAKTLFQRFLGKRLPQDICPDINIFICITNHHAIAMWLNQQSVLVQRLL